MADKFSDHVIGQHKYRIEAVDPVSGNWCVLRLADGGYKEIDVYRKITDILLAKVSRYEIPPQGGIESPMPISVNGKFIYDLDVYTVDAITRKAMDFNFNDFFERRKKEGDGPPNSETTPQ